MALSKISLFKSPIAIKPDLSQEERNIENFLLKKRWSLTQLGIDKKRIKIRNKSILIDNKLYGQFKNSEFSRSQYNPPLEAMQKSQPNKEQSHLTDADTSEIPWTIHVLLTNHLHLKPHKRVNLMKSNPI